ncbi:MAG: hypothetical protein LC105_11195 [Chitinophagales bacterium]|nr:hypothetical protein [Chitinophagales bacterium]MCZ2394415.1 hypothetical protein [Chitinophagales bacterium]
MLKNLIIIFSVFILSSCKVENLNDKDVPKTDFSNFDYVLTTEDASDVDITTFFSFNLKDINPNESYDLIDRVGLFTNSNPSTSSGHLMMDQFIFSMAKDKKGYSSTPGLYKLTLNTSNRMYIADNLHIAKNNLFPARQLCIVDEHLGYFYDESKMAQGLQIFDPSTMVLKGSIDLKPAIAQFRPDTKWVDESYNNLVRVGSTVLEANQGKLYASVIFMESAGYNLIADSVNHVYLAVIDIQTSAVEKIISYEGAKTVGFFVSENKATTTDEDGNIYFCSWGWNQFNQGNPSKVFRIKSGFTDFDTNWVIDIESLFGVGKIAQSIISFNNKIYLHVSNRAFIFGEADQAADKMEMSYYEFDPQTPNAPKKLEIPVSNSSTRMNVFSIVDNKLFIAVPNIEKGKFNGMYSIDTQGEIKKELTVSNKYRPTRLYKLHDSP